MSFHIFHPCQPVSDPFYYNEHEIRHKLCAKMLRNIWFERFLKNAFSLDNINSNAVSETDSFTPVEQVINLLYDCFIATNNFLRCHEVMSNDTSVQQIIRLLGPLSVIFEGAIRLSSSTMTQGQRMIRDMLRYFVESWKVKCLILHLLCPGLLIGKLCHR